MKTIAIVNQKGGVAKTTTTFNLATALAAEGHNVLMIDLDPQASLTISTGISPESYGNENVCRLFQRKTKAADYAITVDSTAALTGDRLYIIPSDINLAATEMDIFAKTSREKLLKKALKQIESHFDYCFIDCPPNLGMLTINALTATDSVIVPVQAHYLPLKGMTQLMKTIGKVQRQLNRNLKIDGVLLTLADMRTKLAKTTEDSLRENYGKHIRIFKTVIPVAITAAESSAAGQSIYEYDKNGTVAKAYAEFTREVIQCGEKQRNKHESSLSR